MDVINNMKGFIALLVALVVAGVLYMGIMARVIKRIVKGRRD